MGLLRCSLFSNWLVLLASIFVFNDRNQIKVEAAGAVGDRCYYNADCTATYSYCRVNSPTCGAGTCSCVPGFQRGSDGSCKKIVNVGYSCSLTNDVCVAANSACLNGVCTCSQGYSRGLKGTDCVSGQKSVRYGSACTDNTNCHYGMVCTNSVCTCSTGQKSVSDYDCTPRTLYDLCSSNDDCSLTPNTVCSNGVCSCQGGYRAVTYMTSMKYPTKFSYACIPNIESLKVEGAQCSNSVGASGTALCMKPFVCTQCDNSGYFICGRVVPLLIFNKAPAQVMSTPILVTLATIGYGVVSKLFT